MTLAGKKCVACEAGTPPLTTEQIEKYKPQIESSWNVTGKLLSRDFKFKDFKEALDFTNKVGAVAEEEDHHPDIHLTGYNKVKIELSTHAVSGLSENDFILAAKIDQLKN